MGNNTYSQSGQCLQIGPIANGSTSGMPQMPFDVPPNVTLAPNSDPDSQVYPDPFPTRRYVYKVLFHIIRNDDRVRVTGTVGEAQVMNAIRDLNLNYKQFNIYFKYGGMDYLDNTALARDHYGLQDLINSFNTYYDKFAFHLFVLDGSIVFTDPDGSAVEAPGLAPSSGTVAFFSTFGISSARVVSHEIGHSFKLKHDFTNYGNVIASEHVTRNTIVDGYNAIGSADFLHSTPATRIWPESQYDTSGLYVGSDIDYNTELPESSNDRAFRSVPTPKNNFMHVHDGPDYAMGYFFTPGQGMLIRNAIATDIINQYDAWYKAEVDERELYKPFDSRYMGGDHVISVTNNPDGTAHVCRAEIHRDRYQKGIKYSFVHGQADELFSSATEYELKTIDKTADYSVVVTELHPDHKFLIDIDCTRGVFCNDENYISGIIYSTQVLGSMNITVEELNEIEVRDPALYDRLMSEYYYILKRYTESGVLKQEVFYKP